MQVFWGLEGIVAGEVLCTGLEVVWQQMEWRVSPEGWPGDRREVVAEKGACQPTQGSDPVDPSPSREAAAALRSRVGGVPPSTPRALRTCQSLLNNMMDLNRMLF